MFLVLFAKQLQHACTKMYRYESKRQEIEAWLMRMENRAERMGQAASQADVLDFSMLESQQKEQKVGEQFFLLSVDDHDF